MVALPSSNFRVWILWKSSSEKETQSYREPQEKDTRRGHLCWLELRLRRCMRAGFVGVTGVPLSLSRFWFVHRSLETACLKDSWLYRSEVSEEVVWLPGDGWDVDDVEGAVPDSAAAWLVAEIKVQRPARVCQTGFNYGL